MLLTIVSSTPFCWAISAPMAGPRPLPVTSLGGYEHASITIEEGSTNVYADLGYTDAAEMQRKSQLAGEIAGAIKARRLTQEDAATLLGIDQSKVSRITRGQFRGVSEAKLLELVAGLGHDVKIVEYLARTRHHQAAAESGPGASVRSTGNHAF